MRIEAQDSQQNAAEPEGAKLVRFRRTRKRFSNIGGIFARALLLCILLIALITSLTPWGQAAARAAFILPSLLLTDEPLALQIAGEPITHTRQEVQAKHGTLYLDIYTPTATPLLRGERQGVLLLPGVGDQRQVPQLINLSQTLARSGIVVMSMTTSTLLQDTVTAEDVQDVVQAFQLLTARPELRGQRNGMIAFSAGVPLITAAAADTRIRDQVAYVTAFGGYYNAETLLETFGRRAISFDGKTQVWQPTTYALDVLTNVTTETLSYDERYSVRQALRENGTPLTPMEQEQLSPEARAVYQLLSGSAPGQVAQNMNALTPTMRAQLRALSASSYIKDVHAPFYLMHDSSDAFLPFTETRAFDRDLTLLHHKHGYVELHIFEHVEVRSNLQGFQVVSDGSKLFQLIIQVFQAA